MKLREAIKLLDLLPDEEIFIHIYQKNDFANGLIAVKDVSKKDLKRETINIQRNHGGTEYGYCHYQFIVR